ncbi:DNRLRE domain-containing protein [Micromonospora harpali]|uniref:DNRLRE domain-containing protein n=1 Tax=Micromonospora harpali TaxID=1490225 RepID=A0ABW1HN25_9ACTN
MPRSRFAAVLALAVLAGTLTFAPAARANGNFVFFPTNDSYVSAGSPNSNFDNQPVLAVAANPTRISYLKFAVTGLLDPVIHARLRIHVSAIPDAGSRTGGTVYRSGTSWLETTLTYANRPALTGAPLGTYDQVAANTWDDVEVTAAVVNDGIVSFGISSADANGAYYDTRESGSATAPQLLVETGIPGTGENVLLAAGDIASCDRDNDEQTARILDREPGTVAALGDLVYETGTPAEFTNCYGPTWGRHKARTRPAVGNHEYLTANAAGYFGYFGPQAGPPGQGWYSYDMPAGGWHIIVLNSNCSKVGGCQVGSPQERWLRADLAANPARCTLAYWHHPIFSSGDRERPELLPLFRALYEADVEILLSGHAHQYERFAPQTPNRVDDPMQGIRNFVVGTGGRSLQPDFGTIVPNSEVRNGTTYGVLKLTLVPGIYQWRFLPVANQTFTESGAGTCH